ncbi:MAG: protein phosphatase 2C domain-containing protein [Myxococcales bacterium]|nr:protein phosphatase 2C domain-containing protein [Myxococcales bacterium]
MQWRGVGQTHSGRQRDLNDDAHHCDDGRGLYVVADGLGDEKDSRLAATAAIQAAVTSVGAALDAIDGEADRAGLVEVVRQAVLDAARDVYWLGHSGEERAGFGSSLTLVLVRDGFAVVAHVGDCRVYLVREGSASQVTIDHRLANELDEGEESAFEAPSQRALIRMVGNQPTVTVDAFSVDLLAHDRLLLCSDGMARHIESEQWLAFQLKGDALDALAEELIVHANDKGGEDNATVVLVALDPSPGELERERRRSTAVSGRLNALARVFLFQSLPVGLLSRVLTHCEVRKLAAGDVLIEEGAPCDQLVVVVKGALDVRRGDEVCGTIEAGGHTGAPTLLRPREARSTLQAVEKTTVIALHQLGFWTLVKARPRLGINLLERLVVELGRELDASIARLDDGRDDTNALDPYERL